MKLSIIIPVFNEEKFIAHVLKRIEQVQLPKSIKKEIIVIDDGSTDRTHEVLSKQRIRFKYFRHKKNRGKGAAIKTGLSKISGDLVIIQDADLEYNPDYYLKLLQPILKDHASVVYGSRLINYPLKLWGKDKTTLPTHLIANKFLTFLTNLLYMSNLTDMETGYKLFKKSVIDKVYLKSEKFDFEAEITAKIIKRGIPIIEVPIIVTPRTYEEGKKIGVKDGIKAIWTLIKYRFKD